MAICLLTGYVSSMFQSDSLETWYPLLIKSPLTPPSIAFPIAWTILYVCMGVSIALVLSSNDVMKLSILTVFVVQLILNFCWTILFFYYQLPLLALIDLILLEIVVIYYIVITYNQHLASALLFVPYALWLAFAGYLNTYICANN